MVFNFADLNKKKIKSFKKSDYFRNKSYLCKLYGKHFLRMEIGMGKVFFGMEFFRKFYPGIFIWGIWNSRNKKSVFLFNCGH